MPPSPPPPPPKPSSTIGSKPASLDDILITSISGVLQKWVNYGRGWRRRWFVLHDGILSYFKIHGPDKIHPQPESASSKLIGDQSLHFLSKIHAPADKPHPRPKPVGEVHLKVSTVRESRSDDRRFSIFTGTKRLHLRAETREDRVAWVEALRAVKEMYPRVSNGGEVVAPVETVSTERLRRRLEEEGVGEEVVKECEEIVREEFVAVVREVGLLRWKQGMLVDTLRQMEITTDM